MSFKCIHCGYCCTSITTQINITLGDVQRLSTVMKKSVSELYKEKIIGLFPFGELESPNVFNVDLGLGIPCNLHKDDRCLFHEARPLSCRLFPYWLYAEVPPEHMHEVFEPEMSSHKHHIKEFDVKDKIIYSMYVFSLHKILYEEDHRTDKILKALKMKWAIDLKKESPEKYEEIESDTKLSLKEKDIKKIRHCIGIINKKDFTKEFEIIEKKLAGMKFHYTSELINIENLLKQG